MKKTIYNLCEDGTLNLVVAAISLIFSFMNRTNSGLSLDFYVAFWANIILFELKANKE